MNQEEVKKILHDQLQLIAERSKEADTQELVGLTNAMTNLIVMIGSFGNPARKIQ